MDGGQSSSRESNDLRAQSGCVPQTGSVLKAAGVEPADRECGDTLDYEVVESA